MPPHPASVSPAAPATTASIGTAAVPPAIVASAVETYSTPSARTSSVPEGISVPFSPVTVAGPLEASASGGVTA